MTDWKRIGMWLVSFMSIVILVWKFITTIADIRERTREWIRVHQLKVQSRSGNSNFSNAL